MGKATRVRSNREFVAARRRWLAAAEAVQNALEPIVDLDGAAPPKALVDEFREANAALLEVMRRRGVRP